MRPGNATSLITSWHRLLLYLEMKEPLRAQKLIMCMKSIFSETDRAPHKILGLAEPRAWVLVMINEPLEVFDPAPCGKVQAGPHAILDPTPGCSGTADC